MVPIVAAYAALGFGLGFVTSMIPGVANLAVVASGVRGDSTRALGLAAGAAVADTLHATAAMLGMASLVATGGLVPALLLVFSGTLVSLYGIHGVVRATRPHTQREPIGGRSSVVMGLLLTLFNPGALLAWVVVAGVIAPPAMLIGVATAVGVGAGAFTALWLLTRLAVHGRNVLAHRRGAITRGIGVVLAGLGLLTLARGVSGLLAG